MIIDFILHAIFTIISSIISVFPSIPAIDSSIASAGNWIVTTVGTGSAFAHYIYGDTLLDALIALAVTIWAFEPVYHAIIWVIRKLPFLSIH